MSVAATTPAAATTARVILTPRVAFEVTAATEANGISAAVSSRPSRKSVSTIVPTPGSRPVRRRTTATRTTSSKRPGSATPVTVEAPVAAASVSGVGRSCERKSRCQPNAFSAYVERNRAPATATSFRSAPPSGQPTEVKCLATRANVPRAASPNPAATTLRPRGERHAARKARMSRSHGWIVSRTSTATGSTGRRAGSETRTGGSPSCGEMGGAARRAAGSGSAVVVSMLSGVPESLASLPPGPALAPLPPRSASRLPRRPRPPIARHARANGQTARRHVRGDDSLQAQTRKISAGPV